MKIFKSLLILGFVLISNNTVIAKSMDKIPDPLAEKAIQIVQGNISEMLRNKFLDLSEERVVTILLAINNKNRIVVLDTNSEDAKINDFVRRHLNYKLLPGALKKGRGTFICPVKLTPEF